MKPGWTALTVGAALGCAALAIGCGGDDGGDPCLNLKSGEACTWAGTKGEEGFNGDGLKRWETKLNQPQDLLFLPDGTAWVTDFNNFLIRRVLPDDTVETMVGSLQPIFPGDGPIGGIPADGAPGLTWELNHPTNLLLDPDGQLIVIAWHNHKILNVDPEDGYVTVMGGKGGGFAGDGGPVAQALFKQVDDGTLDEDGNLYVVDQQNHRVRRISADRSMIETIAGTGDVGYSGDGGPALDAEFSWAFGSNPNPSGGIVYNDGKLYVSDTEANAIRVIDLDTGIIDAFAGTGEKGDSGDGGPAIDAELRAPRDLEIGPDGDLYFADTDNSKVRAIDLDTGDIRTVVGTGELGVDEAERLPATEFMLRRPFGVSFDPDGNLYVLDTLNSRIVKVAL